MGARFLADGGENKHGTPYSQDTDIESGRNSAGILTHRWELEEIEAAYGCALSAPIRQSIVEATNRFLAFEVFERNAKPLGRRWIWLKSIKAVSDKLRKILSTAGDDAGAFAQSAIKEHFSSAHLRRKPYEQLFHALGDVMFSLSGACTQALADMDDLDATVFRNGSSWDNWIRALTKIAEQNDLPSGASKAGNPKADVGPFARLIAALQEHLPIEARKHANTRLSAAIYSARQPVETIEEL